MPARGSSLGSEHSQNILATESPNISAYGGSGPQNRAFPEHPPFQRLLAVCKAVTVNVEGLRTKFGAPYQAARYPGAWGIAAVYAPRVARSCHHGTAETQGELALLLCAAVQPHHAMTTPPTPPGQPGTPGHGNGSQPPTFTSLLSRHVHWSFSTSTPLSFRCQQPASPRTAG